jgi:protein involved in polysaccharide export with SLBB domain
MGRVVVEGLSLSCVEAALKSRYFETFNAPATISVALGARAPALVTGAVRSPGSYHLTEGMRLSHLLSIAGGASELDVAAADSVRRPLQARRAELRRLYAGIRLELLALAAARAGSPDLMVTSTERASLIAEVGAARLESESASLRAQVKAAERARDELVKRLDNGRGLVEILSEEAAKLEEEVSEKRARLDALLVLGNRGLSTLSLLSAVESALSQLERSLFDSQVRLVAAQETVRADEEALAAMAGEIEERIARDIRDRTKEADALDAQIDSIDTQLAHLSDGDSMVKEAYRITRVTSKGIETVVASPSSLLIPGDVVEVERVGDLNLSRN